MATMSRTIVDKLIAGNGRIDPEESPDNPWVERIVEYTDQGGQIAYGVTFGNDDPNKYLRESEYIRNPSVFWERGTT